MWCRGLERAATNELARPVEAALLDAAAGYSVKAVRVNCSLETLRKRERERGDRFVGSAEASWRWLYPKEGYDLEIDSERAEPAALAERILEALL